MEKYGVLFLIIVYFIAAGITTVIFDPQYGYPTSVMGATPESVQQIDTGLTGWRFLTGGFTFFIPGVPAIITTILIMPMYLLLAYFIYCNLPKSIVGTPQP